MWHWRRAMGIDPNRNLKTLVLSHLHHDHADGLEHFKGTEIIGSDENYQASKGLKGSMLGAVPSQWPSWFEPQRREFHGHPVAGFDACIPLTDDGTASDISLSLNTMVRISASPGTNLLSCCPHTIPLPRIGSPNASH